ncbi:MAG TPA: hypothetical protein VND22_09550 [Actinomycetota bacterium]|nr:hypothetical protein [Actinomycetota bacterium]
MIVILLLHAAAAVLIVLTLGIKMRPEKQVIRSRSATTTDQNPGSDENLKEATNGKEGSPETPASENATAPRGMDEEAETSVSQTLAVPPLEPIELRTEPLPLQSPPREADPTPAEEDAIPAAGVASETLAESSASGPSQTASTAESGPGHAEPAIQGSEAVSSVETGGLVPEGETSSSATPQPGADAGPITPASPMTATSATSAPAPDSDVPLGDSPTSEPLSSAATPLRSPASGWTRSSVPPATSQDKEGPSPVTTERTENDERSQIAGPASPSDTKVPGAGLASPTSPTQTSPSVPNASAPADSSAAAPPFFDLDAKPAEEAAASRSFSGSKTEPATPATPPQTSEDLGSKLEALLKPKADPGRSRESARQSGLSATSAYEAASRVEPVRKPVDNLIPDVIPGSVKVSAWRGGVPLGIGRSITRLALAIMLFSVVLSLLAVLAVSWLGSIMRGIAG